MKNFFLFIVVFVLLSACSEKKTTYDTITIARGQMPAIAKDANNNIHLVYGTGDSIMYTYSSNKGRSFAKPVVIDTLNDLVDYATRGPQIAATENNIIVIAVNRQGNIFSFVQDAPDKWTKTARVNDEDTVNKEGFLGLASDGKNNLFSIWPDLRDDSHQKIYGARSTDGGKTWNKNILVYKSPESTICECCKPSVAILGSNVYVMFRNLLNGNRDLYLVRSDDGGNSFGNAEKLGTGSWQLNGCPMDGGGLAIAKGGVVQTVWRRQSKIYAAIPGMSEKEIGDGKGCTVETVNGRNIYAWTGNDGNIICPLPDGTKKTLGKGSLPVLKAISDDLMICVWEGDKNIHSTVFTF
jgi:hypothetical protein